MMKKSGFTLAEVLITLGIIGVVAAMTIPTLIANTNSAKFRSQFKKSISTLNQAGLMAQAQYDIDYSTPTAGCGATPSADNPNTNLTICGIFNGTLSGHSYVANPYGTKGEGQNVATNITKQTTDVSYEPSDPAYLSLADGSLVVFSKTAYGCTKRIGTSTVSGNNCVGYIDVNGAALPNKEVTCDTAANTKTVIKVQKLKGGDGDDANTLIDDDASGTGAACTVPNDANHMTDIFPIVFHDATVEPLTNAGRYVLTTSK